MACVIYESCPNGSDRFPRDRLPIPARVGLRGPVSE